MQCLDDISKVIPEGTYLEMCDKLKKIHDSMPRHEDPPVIDLRGVPFQAVPRGDVIDLREVPDVLPIPDVCIEYVNNENILEDLLVQLKNAKVMLSKLKVKRNITRAVKSAAIREKVMTERIDPATTTFRELCIRIPSLMSTSEYDFYRSYIDSYNRDLDVSRIEMISDIDDIEVKISEIEDRQNFLYETYNL